MQFDRKVKLVQSFHDSYQESLNQVKDNNNYKSIQVITLEENEKIVMVKIFV